jgi:hypothetical protein
MRCFERQVRRIDAMEFQQVAQQTKQAVTMLMVAGDTHARVALKGQRRAGYDTATEELHKPTAHVGSQDAKARSSVAGSRAGERNVKELNDDRNHCLPMAPFLKSLSSGRSSLRRKYL